MVARTPGRGFSDSSVTYFKISCHVNYVQNANTVSEFAMKQNITLSLDTATLKHAKQLAAQRNLSVSKLLAEDLSNHVAAERRYEQARRQALTWLQKGALEFGGKYLSRDSVHHRDK